MELVVDANVLFSAAINDSATAAILLRDDIQLVGPAYLFEEFVKYRETLLERTHWEPAEFEEFLRILKSRIRIVPRCAFVTQESDADRICPDPKDVPYVALALALDACLWSDDSDLKQQTDIPVCTTSELVESIT